MKNNITLIAIVLLSAITMSAQEIRFGAKLGANISSISVESEDYDYGNKVGLHLGGVGQFMFGEKFGLQVEALFSQIGIRETDESEFGDFESKLKLNYITLPVMARYNILDGLSVHAGPQLALLVSAKAKNEFTANNGDTETDEDDVKSFFKSSDIGFAIGAQYELDMGVFAGLRYIVGIGNIGEEEEFGTAEVRNNVLQLSIGYMF